MLVTLDGQEAIHCSIWISRSEKVGKFIRLITSPDKDYYEVLEPKVAALGCSNAGSLLIRYSCMAFGATLACPMAPITVAPPVISPAA